MAWRSVNATRDVCCRDWPKPCLSAGAHVWISPGAPGACGSAAAAVAAPVATAAPSTAMERATRRPTIRPDAAPNMAPPATALLYGPGRAVPTRREPHAARPQEGQQADAARRTGHVARTTKRDRCAKRF